ncbi:MAG: hypothetical protein DRJ52_06580 [Thermoprotei archaeon]|nr:MAG: hypothetical protein DRJ52_06580 [Thermoprotei archaeon]RLE99949.1 MAG: hypothetical protein DRJ63_03825 [Thermoprotei archaeon]HDI74462.1 hypothetical protein [Thermoprotei archaeon]
MPKIRIEETLPSGEKVVITLEGRDISERRVLQVLELLKIMSSGSEGGSSLDLRSGKGRLKELIWDAILENFGSGVWFSSRDLCEVLRRAGVNVGLNTVATYLLRFYKSGLLDRAGGKFDMRYRVRNLEITLD